MSNRQKAGKSLERITIEGVPDQHRDKFTDILRSLEFVPNYHPPNTVTIQLLLHIALQSPEPGKEDKRVKLLYSLGYERRGSFQGMDHYGAARSSISTDKYKWVSNEEIEPIEQKVPELSWKISTGPQYPLRRS